MAGKITTGQPPFPRGNVQTFIGDCTVDSLQNRIWTKPRGVSMVHIFCLGGGGAGGGGFTGVASSARGGGGGGGSSGHGTLLVAANLIPDVLYVQSGAGGIGTLSGGGTAPSGIRSFVSISTNVAIPNNVLIMSGAAGPTGGVTGTVGAGGGGGSAGSVAVIASMCFAHLGFFDVIAGQAGTAGGAATGSIGTAQSIPQTTCLTMGGPGGAGVTGTDFAGGVITATADSLVSEMRPLGPAAGSNNGSGGFVLWQPFWSFCGIGGSSANVGVGGAGGPGGYGSGGAGGGGGTTGGRGGDGGNGLVIITSW